MLFSYCKQQLLIHTHIHKKVLLHIIFIFLQPAEWVIIFDRLHGILFVRNISCANNASCTFTVPLLIHTDGNVWKVTWHWRSETFVISGCKGRHLTCHCLRDPGGHWFEVSVPSRNCQFFFYFYSSRFVLFICLCQGRVLKFVKWSLGIYRNDHVFFFSDDLMGKTYLYNLDHEPIFRVSDSPRVG